MNEILWLLKWMFMVLAFFFFFFVLPLYSIIVIGLMCMGLMSEERFVIFMESLESILG